MKTLRVCPDNLRHVKEESLVCGNVSQSRKPLGSRMMMSARLAALRELQSATGAPKGVLREGVASVIWAVGVTECFG
jgi:hypothetical protein